MCGLCQEAEKLLASGAAQTGELPVGFIKDASPRKPNRTLALPLDRHGRGMQELADLNAAERASLWGAAIRKAQELWPGVWGLAVNSPGVRSQCHLHVHIGKLNDGVEDDDGVAVSAPEEIPLPLPGMGIWIHPVAQGWHVHAGREAPELVLMR